MTITWAGEECRFPQVQFRRVFRPLRRPVPEGSAIVTAYTNGDVTLRSNRRVDGYHEAADLSGFQGVEAGDFVVHGLDILRGSVGVSDSRGAISSVCVVSEPRRDSDARYFAYAIRAQSFTGFPRALARGVREGGADFRRWDTLATLPVPLPPRDEQEAIADYLDARTSRIDKSIDLRRRMAAVVRERWLAEIDMATSVGSEVRVRRLVTLITSGPRGWSDLVGDVGRPFIRSANLRRHSIRMDTSNLGRVAEVDTREGDRSRTRPGDICVGITGANSGWVGLVDDAVEGGYVSQHVALLRPTGCSPQWLALSIAARRCQDQLLGEQYGGTKQQLGLGELANLLVRVPTADEQTRITNEILLKEQQVEALLGFLQRQVLLLQEHRQALITAAVTGQIDVTKAVA